MKNGQLAIRPKASDIQVSQRQQEEPVYNVTMVSPGMYSHLQFTAIEQQQMAYLKIQNRSHIFTHLLTQSSSDPVKRQTPIPERGPYTVQYNGSLPYSNQSGVVENYYHSPPDSETLTHRDTVSEMKR